MWDKVKSLLSGGAPLVGRLLAGPAGGAVGTMVAKALGTEDTPEAIEKELVQNPDALIKIKELETRSRPLLEEMRLRDIQDARNTELKRLMAGGSNRFMYVLATVVVIGFFGIVGALFFKAIPDGSKEVAYILFGTLSASFGSIMQYFFGSSKGSKEKTEMFIKGR
jgi:hypothetical protein